MTTKIKNTVLFSITQTNKILRHKSNKICAGVVIKHYKMLIKDIKDYLNKYKDITHYELEGLRE